MGNAILFSCDPPDSTRVSYNHDFALNAPCTIFKVVSFRGQIGHDGRKPIETSVTEFCYKSVNLSLEKLKNIKIILFCNTRTVQVAKFPEISSEISHF